jgi:Amt family ammonium transporter
MTRRATYEELEEKVRDLRRRLVDLKANPPVPRDTGMRYRQIVEHTPDIIWSADARTMRFTFLSPAFEAITGRAAKEAMWRKIEDAVTPESFTRLSQAAQQAANRSRRGGTKPTSLTQRLEIALLDRQGRPVPTEAHLTFLFDSPNTVTEMLGVSRLLTGDRPAPPMPPPNDRLPAPVGAESEEPYRAAFENAANATAIIAEDTTILLVNGAFERLAGMEREQIESRMSLQMFISEKERARLIQYHVLRRTDMPLVPKTYETEWINREGRIKPVYIAEAMISGSKHSVVTFVDLTEVKAAEEAILKQRAYFRQLFENSPQAILIVGTDGKIIDANKGYETLFGYNTAEIVGEMEQGIAVPEDRIEESQQCQQTMLRGESFQNETQRRRKDGSIIPVSFLGYPIRIRNRIEGYFCIYNDISERKAFEAELHHQAFYDSLTGIPNRALFMERLGRALERAKRRKEYAFSVLLVDVDRFKRINDSLGHLFGDKLLIEIARRFSASIRSMDTVARLGGDEFAILFEEFNSPNEVLDMGSRILNESKLPFTINGNEVHISASIGIVSRTHGYNTSEEILRDADIAMYHAKAQGRAQFRVFDRKMLEQAVGALKQEKDLRLAIDQGQLELYYQPIVCLKTQRIEGLEALVRWLHPKHGIIRPEQFIPLAEETGLITKIGRWVIGEACRQIGEWQQSLPESQRLTVSVNITVKEFMQEGLVDYIAATLRDNGVGSNRLKLELTESMLMEDSATAMDKLRRLKDLGVRLAIDDFGTGYSSLSYLNKFPIDSLKIDRSFIHNLSSEEDSTEIVRTIVSLGRNLGYLIVAEGVESDEQLHLLRSLDCDQVQGFFFSEPVNSAAAARLIKNFS